MGRYVEPLCSQLMNVSELGLRNDLTKTKIKIGSQYTGPNAKSPKTYVSHWSTGSPIRVHTSSHKLLRVRTSSYPSLSHRKFQASSLVAESRRHLWRNKTETENHVLKWETTPSSRISHACLLTSGLVLESSERSLPNLILGFPKLRTCNHLSCSNPT